MPVSVSESIEIAAPANEVFALAAGARLPDFIKPNGPLPGVAGVSAGAWATQGDKRKLTLTDGSSLNEELTSIARDKSFSYRATGFTGPFALLVAEGRGTWTFAPAGPSAVKVTWDYAFAPKGALAAPFVSLIANALWPGYMRAALRTLKTEAEKAKVRA